MGLHVVATWHDIWNKNEDRSETSEVGGGGGAVVANCWQSRETSGATEGTCRSVRNGSKDVVCPAV
jgi:hypothetical protein